MISCTAVVLLLSVDLTNAAEFSIPRRITAARPQSRRTERPEAQPKKKAKAEDATPAPRTKLPAQTRYQMERAGNRVIILDTQTGETKIIEPSGGKSYQSVDVGRAWVVVTVLGNLSEQRPVHGE